MARECKQNVKYSAYDSKIVRSKPLPGSTLYIVTGASTTQSSTTRREISTKILMKNQQSTGSGNRECLPKMEPTTLRYPVGSIVAPGDRLGSVRQAPIPLLTGPGTYSRGGQIFASITGSLQIERNTSTKKQEHGRDEATTTNDTTSTSMSVLVVPKTRHDAVDDIKHGFGATQQVIRQGQTVLARVVRIATQMVMVDIFATEHGLLRHDKPAGVIRREDVKPVSTAATAEQQSVTNAVLTQYYRPGDWVVAKILSLGDTRRYFLTTAEAGLGVIHAVSSTSGQPMVPVSWKEMECPDTGLRETRKCARPPSIPDSLLLQKAQRLETEVSAPMDEGV